MNKFQYLGTSQDITTCDCCGKSNLKSTVVIRDVETDNELFFGVTCAAKALKVGIKEVKAGTAAADLAKEEDARAEAKKAWDAKQTRWIAHLIVKAGVMVDGMGRPDVLGMIKKLGGIKSAEVGFAG
tara:strand:- start:868 stop:1248 length:381 start_codon:yes stop_codon:yes gene_type:complete